MLLLLLGGTLVAGLSFKALRSANAAGTVSLTSLGTPYTQDFNTLALSGTSSTVPTGWDFSESSTNANTTYTAGTGSSNAGDTYSFGSTSSTERAFGGLQSGTLIPTVGASFTNNTGGTITSLAISYTGEQWRLGALARPDRLDFQYSLNATSLTTGTWIDVDALDFTAPVTGPTVGLLNGNLAANRTAISSTITSLSIAGGAVFFIRWNDFNASGADDGLSVDDFSLTPNGVGGGNAPIMPTCPASLMTPSGTAASSPVSATDSDGTVTSAAITSITPSDPMTISLDGFMAAGAPGGNATANLLVGALTPAGTYNVTIRWSNNDTMPQTADCTVAVTVSAPVVLTPIHNIQGSGASSPIAGSTVSTTGIVTGRRTNGFFIQEPDATIDMNPATSEGIFVFTSAAPPAAAAVGNMVQVTGTVSEFIPSADPFSPPLTELTFATVSLISSGNSLPNPIALTAIFPDPAGPFDQLERHEGMRVSVSSFTVVGPTAGNVNEANATSTSDGVFYGVVTGVARPFREPGIQAPDPPPSGSIPPIPRFDTNPERIRVDSDAQPGSAKIDVATGQVITGLVGPLDYGFRAYTILPDPPPAPAPLVTGSLSATPVPIAAANQLTVGSFNLERFFDTVNDPAKSDSVLTPTAFANRLNKASLAIRNVLRTPDILGVVEMENLSTLQALAAKISADATGAGQDDPNYQSYLVEGNDIGGIDVGFLVKSPRVFVVSVSQEGGATTWIDPSDNAPHTLNDRPPLMLRATVDGFAITVIVNHLRSFIGIDSTASDGMTTEGNRVRQKRKAQAEFLANLVQARQTADPNERIVLVGDFNAFQFNDGYVDVMGGIKGTPAPAAQVVVPISDIVNPDLTNLVDAVTPTERYSYVFEGNAQVLDHVLVTSNVNAQLFYARNDADFPETFRNDSTRPERISDHDIPVAYLDIVCQITCPANITVPSEPAQCGASVNFSTTDTGCGDVVCTPPSGSFFPAGTTTVTCAENAPAGAVAPKDAAGTAPGSSCSFTVTVTETEAPVITCPGNIAVSNDSGQCSAVVNFTVTATDNCPGVTVVSSPPSGGMFPKGTTTVTATATDAAGNSSSCSFTVTVSDTQAPSITCPANVTVSNDPGQCSAVVNFPSPTVIDNCPKPGTPTCAPPSGSTFSKGTTTVNCSVMDASGNSSNCSFTVTVNDTQPPSITCPANITAPASPGQCSAVVNFSVTASDNCPGVVTVTANPPSGSTFPKGTTTVTATATDASGNMASCSFTVTVVDTQPPAIVCPANITAITPGTCATVNYPVPVATDNCPGVGVSCSPPPATCFPLGITTVTCVATDTTGNTASCSFTVTVFDICLQDDSDSSKVVLVNSQTGDYRFCCGGTMYAGRGTIIVRGNVVTLEHNPPGRRVLIRVDKGLKTGTASLQVPPGTVACTIRDTNTMNNTCACQ